MIPLKFIKPSYHGNPNLGAQKGLFTLWEFVTDKQRKNEVEVTSGTIRAQEVIAHCGFGECVVLKDILKGK